GPTRWHRSGGPSCSQTSTNPMRQQKSGNSASLRASRPYGCQSTPRAKESFRMGPWAITSSASVGWPSRISAYGTVPGKALCRVGEMALDQGRGLVARTDISENAARDRLGRSWREIPRLEDEALGQLRHCLLTLPSCLADRGESHHRLRQAGVAGSAQQPLRQL